MHLRPQARAFPQQRAPQRALRRAPQRALRNPKRTLRTPPEGPTEPKEDPPRPPEGPTEPKEELTHPPEGPTEPKEDPPRPPEGPTEIPEEMRPQFSAEHPYGIKPQDREQPSEQPEPSGTASGQREKQERVASPSDSSDGERARRRSPSRGSDESEAYHTGEDDSRSSSRTKSENTMGADYDGDPSESSGASLHQGKSQGVQRVIGLRAKYVLPIKRWKNGLREWRHVWIH